jgi:hypothetical protein
MQVILLGLGGGCVGAGDAGQVAHVSPPFSDGYDGMDDHAVVDEVGVVVRQRWPVN